MKYYNKIKDNDDYFIKKNIGNVPAYYLSEKNVCKNDNIKKLYKNNDIYFYKNTRVWKHKKNNFTQWHYDGNGINVLNIPMIMTALEQGKPMYVCAPSNI
jgi:hypothetical protein